MTTKNEKHITVTIENQKALVETPYNGGFVRAIKSIGGARWTGSAWSIPIEALENARELMRKHYGEDDTASDEKITVRCTIVAEDDLEELQDSVSSLGKTLARATGRDSGARVGDDVVLIQGRIGSGGSMKNWKTCVKTGSVFELHNVSKTLYDKGYDMYKEEIAKYEVVNEQDKRTQLLAEKERLLVRLAEIEKMLA